MQLNINTDAVVTFTNKLERINRSAMPVSVRGALNNAAFDVKQNTMPKISSEKFTNRQANFFKANSRVQMASGFDIDSMESTVGFISDNLKGSTNFAVKNLEQQERGGTIKGKSFIPMRQARASQSDVKAVRPSNRISSIKNIVDAKKSRFAASHRAGVGGYIQTEKAVFRVDSLSKKSFKITPLHSFKKGRSVQVKSTGFMKQASNESGSKIEKFFIEQAQKQFEKA